MLVEVQKGYNAVTCILDNLTYPNNLQTKGVQIIEDAVLNC